MDMAMGTIILSRYFLYIPALLCVIGIPVTVSYNIF